MADIAILVAEEYEKRVKKNSPKAADDDASWVFSCASLVAQSVRNKINSNNGSLLLRKSLEFSKLVLEPKSQVSTAASNGVFSA
ncbi:hypothetical protein K2173_014685 [Erythroxylum novogranatense]|uniref:Uncharacterized protein n=1 Tax=Erythroxylum novogranatense TaxID=1862640 RepID=A0AAV8TH01_9ROSI|nr:hypothetical protein K2173_014685 [Erythroxylum novogranatense]